MSCVRSVNFCLGSAVPRPSGCLVALPGHVLFSSPERGALASPASPARVPAQASASCPARIAAPSGRPSPTNTRRRQSPRPLLSRPLHKFAHKCPDWCRSEEHTSELQSRLHLVCRLLLEKKKNLARHRAAVHSKHSDVEILSTGAHA